MSIISTISRLLDVPSTDPDDARRRKLLNILLFGAAAAGLLEVLATIAIQVTVGGLGQGPIATVLVGLATLVGALTIFLINRYHSGWLAGSLFVLLVTIVFAFVDEPHEVANGRSLVAFAIPIVVASVLLPPYASFVAAAVCSLTISALAFSVGIIPNPFAIILFFCLALASWLAASSLERALRDLRTLNRELDQRVVERTRELAEAFSKNQAILEGIADGVIVFDNDGKAALANPAIAHLFERPADEVMGCDIEALMNEDVDAADREMIVSILADKKKQYPSLKFEWGDKTLSVSVAPVHDNAGDVIGTVAVFRDFTREAEMDRMKSAFVSTASHELRTPLNAILGYADMLQEAVYGPLSDKQRDVIKRIIINTGHLLSLTNNLLDQAQIEAGTLGLDVTSFAPTDLIDSVQGVMGILAQAKDLELTGHIANDVPSTLFGDRQRLRQILVNLVGNAIKFTEEGTVCVRVYRPDADHWALEVSDTGRGIPKEAHSCIFEPFRQADESLTREHTGAGLGLSIVKQLTTLMGGEITLASEVGRGSTFTVVLPLVLNTALSAVEGEAKGLALMQKESP